MDNDIKITLPKSMIEELDQFAKEKGINRSAVVRNALSKYFALKAFQSLRQNMIQQAKNVGIFTDEDVFNRM